jgi:DNA mismatch repair protein MutL
MIGPPSLDRANRSYISLYVNRRWVQSRTLGYAIEQAYHGFMMERRYPIAVVNIAIPHEEVDVNAHPAKTEVRFRRENQVFGAIQQAIRATLTAHSPVPNVRRIQTTQSYSSPRPSPAAFWPVQPFAEQQGQQSTQDQTASPHDTELPMFAPQPPIPKKALPVLRVLGQAQNTYIIAEGPDGVYLIDQHAAHERIVFEDVRAAMLSSTPNVQSLLEPVTIELNARQHELVEAHQDVIARLGLVVEPFGGSVFLLRGVPTLLKDSDPAQAFIDVLDLMAEGGDFETWEDRAAYSMACHSAIRAGKTLTFEEMTELTRQLENCQQPNNCPHGRPTMIHMSASHLEREFGRR